MPFVVDASIALCWLLPDEADVMADQARLKLKESGAIAPSLWWAEIRNSLIMNERRGRLNADDTKIALGLLAELPVSIDHEPDEASLIALARKHRLTVYDALYLELAVRRRVQLATLDKALAQAARAEQITTIPG